MRCNNPYEFFGKEGHYYIIPCGRCSSCRVNKRMEWTDRLVHEIGKRDGIFVTLTYDDKHLPFDNSLRKDDLQKFLKRLRYNLHGRKIKYYGVGEYGGKLGRCHFHLIITNMHFKKDRHFVTKSWDKGFNVCLPAVPGDIRYTLKYMEKEQHLKDKLYFVNGQEVAPPFSIMSKGLGLDWILENKQQILDLNGYPRNGHVVSLPRYYRQKLGMSESLSKNDDEVMEFAKSNGLSYFQALQRLGRQAELDSQKKDFFSKKC